MGSFFLAVGALAVRILSSPWFWLLLAAALLCLLVVRWYRRCKVRALEQLEYTRAFSTDGVFAGEYFTFTEILHNTTMFPLFSVKMDFFVPSGFTIDDVVCSEYTKISSLFHIPPHASVKKTHRIRADVRGHYQLETATICYRNTEILFSAPFELYVFPSHGDIRVEMPPDLYHAGDSISRRKYMEDPFFLSAIRPYQLGDPLRSINFKASIRSYSGGFRQLMSNSFDSSRNFDSMILLDLFDYAGNSTVANSKEQLERGLRYACFLVLEAGRQGGSVGFASNCTLGSQAYVHIPCGIGDSHIGSLLKCFAEINGYARRDYSIHSLLTQCASRLPGSTDLYLITPIIDTKTAELIRQLERMGRNVCFISLR